jgi:hypothetical protein
MKKVLTYISFAVASIAIVLMFVTAQTYEQLVVAILSYPILAYLSLNLFKKKTRVIQTNTLENPPQAIQVEEEVQSDSFDLDKRAFLKLLGAAGMSFFFFSLFKGRGTPLGLGSSGGATIIENTSGQKINPAEKKPTDGYYISEIDDGDISFFGYINTEGAWYIMRQDNHSTSIRYVRGESDFAGSWSRRSDLSYDYFHNIF